MGGVRFVLRLLTVQALPAAGRVFHAETLRELVCRGGAWFTPGEWRAIADPGVVGLSPEALRGLSGLAPRP